VETAPEEGPISDAATFWELIERRAARSPASRMFIDERDRELTYGGLRDAALSVAAGLHQMGVGPGSVVSWQLPTTIDTVVVMAALCRLGAVQNPIIHLYREREVGFALRQTGATHLIVPGVWRAIDFPALAGRAGEGMDDPPTIVDLSTGRPAGDPASLPPAPPARSGPDAPIRWIFYTSGTSADPKGVCHTDRTLMAAGWGLVVASGNRPDDVGTIAFPIAHIGGVDALASMLMIGSSSVMVEAFDPKTSIPLFRHHGVTRFGGGPAFYLACLAEQRKDPGRPILPRLRSMSGGGAPKPPQLHFEVRDEIGGRGITHGYGMTEVPMIASGRADDTDEQLAYSDGAPVEGAIIRIARTDGSDAAPMEEGEIRVKGPMVCRGYTDPALTAEAFDDDGWFRTGDLGRLRPDGHVQLTGRLKDVIIRKGENISAKEIEDLLYTHPAVADVAVFGVPDLERGEMVCAVAECKPGADLSFDEMVGFLKGAGLMMQKIPERLEVRSGLPRNATGKILKKDLRKEYAEGASAGPS
jgi:acyl-CoA synthetase (AMP-forming)/AMP-acid ligase II